MALVPWRNKGKETDGGELQSLTTFRHEMDRLFDSIFGESFGQWGAMQRWRPTMDVEETEKEFVVRAEVPGVKPEDIDLSVAGDRLVISGEKKSSSEKKDGGFHQTESYFGSFRREMTLPGSVDTKGVQADYKDGVLTVRLKKVPDAQTKRIPVKSS